MAMPRSKTATDLDAPSDFSASSAPPAKQSLGPSATQDNPASSEDGTDTGDITLRLTPDQASTLQAVLSQLSDQLGGNDQTSDVDTSNDEDDYPLAPAAGPPARSRGGYGS